MTTATLTTQTFDFQLDEFYLDLQEEGRRISILSQDEIVRMPFPGLRPFKTSEFQLFMGRDGQAEELLKRLKHNRFLAVIGSSGTGKSSLVRAGLIPQLFGGYLHEAGDRWNIAICRPGKNPIANLAIALSSVKGESRDKNQLYQNYESIEPRLNSSLYGLLDVNNLLNGEKAANEKSNLLVIVDQFEEIFRYDRKDLGRANMENYFVDLLLKAASNKKSPVYVIITMRSEFLGDCVKYRGLPEAINEGQYLVPGLNRTQLKEVIEGPIHLAGKEISPDLVEFLINEIEENRLKENLDQLPILQHALMRTYQEAARQGAPEITYEHYEKIGRMEKALANHAREKFEELSEGYSGEGLSKKQRIAKLIFQALTDASTDLKGGRRPTELKYIYAIAEAINAGKEEVNEVIETFRDKDTSFIMPPDNTMLQDELIMDISHESLMRNWDLMKTWVEEEVRYGKLYQRLNERRENDDKWMPDLLLQEMLYWRDNYPHNAAWANRYHQVPQMADAALISTGLYNANLAFLQLCEDTTRAEREAEKKALEEKARLQREKEVQEQRDRSRKRLIWILTTAFVMAICLSAWAFVERSYSKKQEAEAIRQTELADEQTIAARRLADSLEIKKQLADSLRLDAERQKEQAEDLAEELAISRQKAIQQAEIAEHFRKEAEMQREDFAKQVVKNMMADEDFFLSEYLDGPTKAKIVEELFYKPPESTTQIDTFTYIRRELLNDVNDAALIRESFEEDAGSSLHEAMVMWKMTNNKTVEPIFLDMFNKNILYRNKVEPYVYLTDRYAGSPIGFSLHKDGRFVFGIGNQVVFGQTQRDTLAITDVAWVNSKLASILPSDSMPLGAPQKHTSVITTLAVPDQNTLLVLQEDGNILQKQGLHQQLLGKIPRMGSVFLAEFSPRGHFLATVSEDNILRLWNMDSIKTGKRPVADTLSNDERNQQTRQLVFSPDEKNLLTSFESGGNAEVWDLRRKVRNPRFGRQRWQLANFTDDNHVIALLSNGYIMLYDSLGIDKGHQRLTFAGKSMSDRINKASEISLSPDRKKLLLNVEGELLLTEAASGDSIFPFKRRLLPLKTKILRSPEDISMVNAKFADRDMIIGLSDGGGIVHWNTGETFQGLDAAFKSVDFIAAERPYGERERKDSAAFEKVYRSGDLSLLREAANYYFGQSYYANKEDTTDKTIKRARMLYSKLKEKDQGYLKVVDTLRLMALERPASGEADIDTTLEIQDLQAAIEEAETRLQTMKTENDEIKDQLSSDYWNLSWYLLFAQNFDADAVIEAAKTGLSVDPKKTGIYTNLALGYLLKGEFESAKAIYAKYRDSTFDSLSETGRPFREAFEQDFKDLEEKGVISADKAAIYKDVQYIRRNILGLK